MDRRPPVQKTNPQVSPCLGNNLLPGQIYGVDSAAVEVYFMGFSFPLLPADTVIITGNGRFMAFASL